MLLLKSSIIASSSCFVLGWTQKFGNVYQFKLGVNTSVVLGDRQSIQEAFVKNSPDVDSRCQWRKCFNDTFKGSVRKWKYSVKKLN